MFRTVQELVCEQQEPLEVIFVSLDDTHDQMVAFMGEAHADWLAVQHGAVLAR
jgi:hypothetical protein